MSESLAEFIERVERFEIDPGGKVLTFSSRLARENRWSSEYAERVIREYKRFCVLAIHAGHPVTPSEAVDQAWHLHLTYSRSYWDRFCGTVLGRPLHHEPTAGGTAEGQKFHDWYTKTLVSYERLFRERPPSDIWPSPTQRFVHSGDWKWHNSARHWLVPRPSAGLVSVVVAAMVLFSLSGCVSLLLQGDTTYAVSVLANVEHAPRNLSDAFSIHVAATVLIVVFTILMRRPLKEQAGEYSPPTETLEASEALNELTADELAVLAGGARRLIALSLLRLQSEEAVDAVAVPETEASISARAETPSLPAGIDQVLYTALRTACPPDFLGMRVTPFYKMICRRLEKDGLRHRSEYRSNVLVFLGLLPFLSALLIAFFWNMLGILLAFHSLLALLVCNILNRRSTRLTPAGRWVLHQKRNWLLQRQASPSTSKSSASGNSISYELLMQRFAIDGAAFARTVPEFTEIATVLLMPLKQIKGCLGKESNPLDIIGGNGQHDWTGCGDCEPSHDAH